MKKSTTPSTSSPLAMRKRAAEKLKAVPPDLRRAVILQAAQKRGLKVPIK